MQRIARALAMLCLALAIGAVIGSVKATLDAGAIEGPSALLVAPRGDVWLGVNNELWRLSAEGGRIDRQSITATGVPGAPANLVRGPGDSVVASVRRNPTLYVLDADTARVKRTVTAQWPAELARHRGRAINVAFDGSGRMAIATGGGDAVALFDADGRFIARTPPNTFVFTNGLWWSDAGLWTTDTNRFTLRLLDAASLQPLRAVEIGRAEGGSFLGPARAQPRTTSTARVALIRFHDNMTDGSVSLVGANDSVSKLPHDVPMQPRDLDWLGDDLLVSDGTSFSILRWSAQGQALVPFGDATVKAELGALRQERDTLRRRYAQWLGAAAVAFVLGVVAAAVASWLERRNQPRSVLDLSRLGTPQVGRKALFELNWRMNKWLFVAALLALAPQISNVLHLLPKGVLSDALVRQRPLVGFVVSIAALLLAIVLMRPFIRHVKRLSQSPDYEPLVNRIAMAQLKRNAVVMARTLRQDEHVLEVFHLQPGLKWWVLTNERLLGFTVALRGSAPAATHDLADVTSVASTPSDDGWKTRFARLDGRAWIQIAFKQSAPVAGVVGSPVLAARLIERITERAAALRPQRRPQAATAKPANTAQQRRAALASLFVPGLGHWQLGYGSQAIVLITVWIASLAFFTVPMLWTLVEPFTAVQPWHSVVLAVWHLLLSVAAAADAWRLHRAAALDPQQRNIIGSVEPDRHDEVQR